MAKVIVVTELGRRMKKAAAGREKSFFYMNKILLNFIQLERTKKEEQTVLWRVGTRRAFPVEEGTCWGQCSCKCHTGVVTKAERMCLGFSSIVLGFFLPTLGFLKPLFFPHQSYHPAAKWADGQERGLLQWNVCTHRATSRLHHQGVCTHSGCSCVEGERREVGFF